jgi:APA family basic amino acid/polyamine antiporter
VPLIPGLSILCCFVLMLGLPLKTWLLFFAWLVAGLCIYFFSGRQRARAAAGHQ